MPKATKEEIEKAITGGIVFRRAPREAAQTAGVRTKAKKKGYVVGQHGSGAAKKKADIRQRRANRGQK